MELWEVVEVVLGRERRRGMRKIERRILGGVYSIERKMENG